MADHKATLVLVDEVYKQIEYLTHNMTTEIGAVGTVKIKKNKTSGENEYVVDKLYFPEQKVTSATVNIPAESWVKLLNDPEFAANQHRLGFYWHRHPGSAAHSGTDDEHTFESFMCPDQGRKMFAFLQTAKKGTDDMDFEARIDITHPVRTTIKHANINIKRQYGKEESAYNLACEKLWDKYQEKEKPYLDKIEADMKEVKESCILPTTTTYNHTSNVKQFHPDDAKQTPSLPRQCLKESKNDFLVMENNELGEWETHKDDLVGLTITNGEIKIVTGPNFEATLLTEIGVAPMKNYLKKMTLLGKTSHGNNKYLLLPLKKKYKDLTREVVRTFNRFNELTKLEYDASCEDQGMNDSFYTEINKDKIRVDGEEDVLEVLEMLDNVHQINWAGDLFATVDDMTGNHSNIGSITCSDTRDYMFINGQELIEEVKILMAYENGDEEQ